MSGQDLDVLHRELSSLRLELERLRADNSRLAKLLGLTEDNPLPDEQPSPVLFGGLPGQVDNSSPPQIKVALFRALFAGRTDVYAQRWENTRDGRSGWAPASKERWTKGNFPRTFLPLTDEVLTSHLTGERHVGLYPLMDADRCRLLVCDFDGSAALLDALTYMKASIAQGVPANPLPDEQPSGTMDQAGAGLATRLTSCQFLGTESPAFLSWERNGWKARRFDGSAPHPSAGRCARGQGG